MMSRYKLLAVAVASIVCFSTAEITYGQGAAPPAGPAPPVASWAEMSGYKRYHANCSTCHGPDGLGGTFAPNLTKSLKTLDHDQFLETVVNGKHDGDLAMPSFGANPNIMCYVEDIYTYLKARSDDKIARGRPEAFARKPADAAAAETACMGG